MPVNGSRRASLLQISRPLRDFSSAYFSLPGSILASALMYSMAFLIFLRRNLSYGTRLGTHSPAQIGKAWFKKQDRRLRHYRTPETIELMDIASKRSRQLSPNQTNQEETIPLVQSNGPWSKGPPADHLRRNLLRKDNMTIMLIELESPFSSSSNRRRRLAARSSRVPRPFASRIAPALLITSMV